MGIAFLAIFSGFVRRFLARVQIAIAAHERHSFRHAGFFFDKAKNELRAVWQSHESPPVAQ